jgi:fatty acid desaturase
VLAVPTIAVLVLAWALWLGGLVLLAYGGAPAAVAVALASLGAYLAFTPLHEAVHRSMARSRRVNELLGRLAAVPLMGPLPAMRHLHLEHHKHTNDPARDPDHYSGRGPAWLLPVRWATQDLHYYWLFLRGLRRRKMPGRGETLATLAAEIALIAALCALGQGRLVLLGWVLPARIAVLVLAFAFDYLPHRPHQIPASVDRLRATRVIDSRILEVLFLGQSHHLVHHLYPAVPFYRYGRIWRQKREALGLRPLQAVF